MSFLKTSSGTLDSTSGGTGTVPLGNYLETETKFLCLKVDCNEHFSDKLLHPPTPSSLPLPSQKSLITEISVLLVKAIFANKFGPVGGSPDQELPACDNNDIHSLRLYYTFASLAQPWLVGFP